MTASAPRGSRAGLPDTPRPAIPPCWPTVIGLALALLLPALGAWALLEARHDAWTEARRSTANLALTLERDLARNLAGIDLSLQGALMALRQPGLRDATPGVRQLALFDRGSLAGSVGEIVVTDAAGQVIESSTELPPAAWHIRDREDFLAHRDNPDPGPHVTRPFRSVRDGETVIALSRRRPAEGGAFEGIVSATLRLSTLEEIFSRLDLGPNGAVALLRFDGSLVARHPAPPLDDKPEDAQSRNLGSGLLFRRMVETPAGHFAGPSILDGTNRLFAFRQVGSLPLAVSVGLAATDVDAPWRHRAAPLGALLAALAAAAALLALLLGRERLARLGAERRARDTADSMAAMATTDALTGLANRRQFDLRLAEEWRRAARNGLPLSLLRLDTDHFHAFRERYGPAEGDQALMGVAACLRLTVRRPADATARYGGEEFAVLLPETDARGAATVAELLREAVEGLTMPHAGSPAGHVTVSVGWCCVTPRKDIPPATLSDAADRALQEAKRLGPNRVAGPGTPGRGGVGRAA